MHPAPWVRELPHGLAAVDAFLAVAHLPHPLFLDSARRDPLLGRYSFVAADPFAALVEDGKTPDALGRLKQQMSGWQSATVEGLPPFQGGAAGLWSYDLAGQLERVPPARIDEFQTPRLAIGYYDIVAAFDHATSQAWLISHGWPETDPARREARAEARLTQIADLIARGRPRKLPEPVEQLAPLAASQLAPQFPVQGPAALTSSFSREDYLRAVARAIEYIHAGDIFQVNLAQRLLHPARKKPLELYLDLRVRNPAPFAGYFDVGPYQIASASPERFLAVRGREVETRPIKGTRLRAGQPEADLFTADQLKASAKDRAENVMIVDLLRNDLSKVCEADSLRVTGLCRLETYQYVLHLVSEVRGRLRDDCDAWDLLRGAFPGGSITGAPKPRAMEIIAELEPTARGPYCGSLGYVGFDGAMDTSILIRTITAGRGWWQAPVGGGIVAASQPADEYAETWHKAEGLLRAM